MDNAAGLEPMALDKDERGGLRPSSMPASLVLETLLAGPAHARGSGRLEGPE